MLHGRWDSSAYFSLIGSQFFALIPVSLAPQNGRRSTLLFPHIVECCPSFFAATRDKGSEKLQPKRSLNIIVIIRPSRKLQQPPMDANTTECAPLKVVLKNFHFGGFTQKSLHHVYCNQLGRRCLRFFSKPNSKSALFMFRLPKNSWSTRKKRVVQKKKLAIHCVCIHKFSFQFCSAFFRGRRSREFNASTFFSSLKALSLFFPPEEMNVRIVACIVPCIVSYTTMNLKMNFQRSDRWPITRPTNRHLRFTKLTSLASKALNNWSFFFIFPRRCERSRKRGQWGTYFGYDKNWRRNLFDCSEYKRVYAFHQPEGFLVLIFSITFSYVASSPSQRNQKCVPH